MSLKEDPLYRDLIDRLEELRAEEVSFTAWSATIRRSRSLQSLLIGEARSGFVPYQERSVEDISYLVQLYVSHGSPVVMGTASLILDPLKPFREQIREGLQNAAMVSNPPWELPGVPEEPYPEVLTADPEIFEHPREAAERFLERACQGALSFSDVRFNSAEFYLNHREEHRETSTGLNLPDLRTDFYFEAACEKLPGPNTQEVHRYRKGVRLSELDPVEMLSDMRQEALSSGKTELPATGKNVCLMVDADVISDWLNALVEQLHGSAEYNGGPFLAPGAPVYEGPVLPDSELLQLDLDPFLEAMVESRAFTPEGLPAAGDRIIESGIVRQQIISHRMGQYLNRAPNRICGNFVVPSGKKTRQELLDSTEECLEILSFSSLLINPRTLTWSSEIKLARKYRKGQEVAMVKGGVASGSIRAHLASALFSSGQIVRNAVADTWHPSIGYRGPSHMLVRAGVNIAGS